MSSRKALLGCLTTIVFAGAVGQAAAAGPSHPHRLLSSKEAMNVDAAALAAASKISKEQARTRLAIQGDSRELIGTLRQAYGDRIAGIYREWTPAPRIVVRLKGTGSDRVSTVVLPSGSVEVAVIAGAKYSTDELNKVRVAKAKALRTAFPTMGATWIDERSGELVISVDAATAAKVDKDLATVIAGVPTRIVAGGRDFNAELSGSGSLDIPDPGTGTRLCTGGFVVNIWSGDTRTPGLSSAGHCLDSTASYTTLDGFGASMVLAGQAYDASSDLQWYTSPTEDYFEATFFSDEVTKRVVGQTRYVADTAVGDAVCKFGSSSGASCGVVTSVNYAPSADCNGQTCAATYVLVEPAAGETQFGCAAGDSGGPVFADTTAYGILKGCGGQVGTSIYAERMFYTPLDALAANDVYVMIPF